MAWSLPSPAGLPGQTAMPNVDVHGMVSNLFGNIGGALKERKQERDGNAAFGGLLDTLYSPAQPAPQQQGGLAATLFGGTQGYNPGDVTKGAPLAAPTDYASQRVAQAHGDQPQGNSIFNSFMNTVRQGGLTNPYGLAAVAATGKRESGFTPENSFGAWSDPSQSGQPGTAGGIMSWRADRLENLRQFAAATGDDPQKPSPQTQAKFLIQEDPTLIQKLQAAQSPEEAQQLMNNAWKFAGYDQPGGEAAARIEAARGYAGTFGGQPLPEQEAMPQNAGMPAQGGSPALTSLPPREVLASLFKSPLTRPLAMEMVKSVRAGQSVEQFKSFERPDGSVWQVDMKTGKIDRVAEGQKQNLVNAGDGQLYDPASKSWITAPGGGDDYAKRRAAAANLGLSPDDPAYRSYVLTGKMPREDQAPLTATDKKAILEADEMVQANDSALQLLGSVLAGDPGKTLNDRAGSGMTAKTQAWLARNDPTGFFDDQKGEATAELENVVIGQALAGLKATFGAAPTEGERKILVELQASVDKTPAERKIIIGRAMEMAKRRLDFNKRRAEELRGGTFYKQGGGRPVTEPGGVVDFSDYFGSK